MLNYTPFKNTDAIDEVLLDVATLIELSPRDRRVAENRYRRLKQHLESDDSALAPYLIDGESMIYAQGSIATSTTIVNGTDDDRFDVDAIVEIDVPHRWNDSQALDLLDEALQGFPGVEKILRCTRCVQLQFPFMHMDVTILDRRQRIPIARAGEIFHSPDEGAAYRVASNPWGFTDWFRSTVGHEQSHFAEALSRHRGAVSRDRLRILDEEEQLIVEKADQLDLPTAIPSAIDAQEAVALKLLKRYLNLRYDNLPLKRPPSIYLTKRAGDVSFIDHGLAAQLFVLADTTARTLHEHLANGTRPEEFNPSYPDDLINDRWPAENSQGMRDMKTLADSLEFLTGKLNEMVSASLSDISSAIDELFGEVIGKEQRRILSERYDRRAEPSRIMAGSRSGAVKATSMATSSAGMLEIPRHHFHPFILDTEDEE